MARGTWGLFAGGVAMLALASCGREPAGTDTQAAAGNGAVAVNPDCIAYFGAEAPARKDPGRIVNISSVGGKQLSGNLLEYGSAKAALDHLTGNMSRRLAPHGITVNAIVPGTVMTPQAARWIESVGNQAGWPEDFATRESMYTRERAQQPVPRLGRAEEIAAAVAFLASPRSDFTTGALLRIDGGNTRAT